LITGTAGSNRAGGNVRRRNAQVWNPHEEFVLDGVGISILPLWMAKDPAIAADLERVLPLWVTTSPNLRSRELSWKRPWSERNKTMGFGGQLSVAEVCGN